jgi:hypothetical protein
MLTLALVMLCAAALIGAILAVVYMRETETSLHWALPALHGLVGAASLAILLAAIPDLPKQTKMGTNGFAGASATLLACALVLGLSIAATVWRRRRPNGAVISVHAGFAIAGLALLLALVALG